jgi:hypothetical protein
VKILSVYLSLFRPLIGADLTADPNGRRHQRQTRGLELAADQEKGKLVRYYADENSCHIFGPDNPTTKTFKVYTTPDVLDIVLT